jgi:hypothetical protein
VDHGVGAAERLALEVAVPKASQVAERDLDLDAMTTEPARITHERTHVVPSFEQ